MTSADDLRAQLSAAGRDLDAADAARRAALDRMAEAMRAGKEAGLAIKEMAALGGVTRVTAYRLIDG